MIAPTAFGRVFCFDRIRSVPGYLLLAAVVLSAVALFWQPSIVTASATVSAPRVGGDDSDEANELAQFYGFSGIELYKLDARVFNLLSGDFNNDGLPDLLVVNNRDSCLSLLAQQTELQSKAARSGSRVNDLQSDTRFDIQQIPVDKQIAGLAAADLNGDGRLDAAYVGVPDQLVVRYQPAKAKEEWSDKFSVRLPGLKPASWMISAGDLNSDGRADLVVLGENVTYVILQDSKGGMASPQSLINTSAQLSMIQIADINGDGKNDLCYLTNEGSTRGLCARLQTSDGRLGPEICFDLQQPRSVTLQNIDQKPGHEIITVESRSNRIVVSGLQPEVAEQGNVPEYLMQYGIGVGGGARKRAICVGDVDKDGLNDVVVADPELAQILLYRQNGIDGLGIAEIYPSLLGTTDISITDIDTDGSPDVVILSEKEGVIATSQFAEGRLTFPATIAKKPEGCELVSFEPISGDDGVQLAVCLSRGSGKSGKLEFQRVVRSEQSWSMIAEKEPQEVIDGMGARGVDLVSMDVNGDGRPDILCIPGGTSKAGAQILLQQEDRSLQLIRDKVEVNPGAASGGGLFVNGSQLLIARDSFARALEFSETGWKVTDQFNAGETAARLEGVATLDLDGEPGDEIVLVDTGVKKLRVLRKTDGLYRPWKEVELGSLSFVSATVSDLNGDQRPDLLLAGSQHFSVLYAGRKDPVLKEMASIKLKRDDAYPADVIAGDLNGDGTIDLTVIDTSINGVEILQFKDSTLEPATHFRVFEEKRLVSTATSRGTEPREGLAVDITGDGRQDLLLLCHDRLIVYPQDTGVPDATVQAAKP